MPPLDRATRPMFDRAMRSTAAIVLTLSMAASIVLAGCQKSRPAESPSPCNCDAKPSARPEPAREEPADLVR